ncbi:MAG: pyridoxamine 5'-phosphate oxidase family protein [Acidimicrobiales bacterium]
MPRTERPDMADYGVTDDPEGLLDWEWASGRLEASRNYWIATASAAGRPHAMPVWGVWLPEAEEFFFSCAAGARKARNLRENPRVVVTAEDSVEVVVVEGTATELRTTSIPDVIARYARKYETDEAKQAELEAFLADTTGFRVVPERAFGIIERAEEFASRATRWVW